MTNIYFRTAFTHFTHSFTQDYPFIRLSCGPLQIYLNDSLLSLGTTHEPSVTYSSSQH